MPFSAPLPVPTTMAVGVARPMAQGQAMMTTVTKASRARVTAGSGPKKYQIRKVSTAIAEHHRHEDAGDVVGQPLDGRLGALGLLDQADDLGERGVAADLGRLEAERAGAVEGGADDLVARALLHRDGFAGEHRLVHRRAPLEHHAVHGDLLARPDDDDVADEHLVHRDVDLDGGAVGDRPCGRAASEQRRVRGRRRHRAGRRRRRGAALRPPAPGRRRRRRRAASAGAGRTTRAVLACSPTRRRMAADV